MPPTAHDRPSPRPRRTSAAARALLAALVVVITASICTPVASAASGHRYGAGPLDSIWDSARATPKCAGLTSAELVAMMMVPTYGEAGGPVPPPMALGRWDNLSVSSANSRLFAFGQTSGPYVNAYWSAGVGLWQFDSAGGWDLTAADAIDTLTSSRQAASTIAYRYCNAPSSVPRDDASLRRYAWGPWFACSTGTSTNCETLYGQLYRGEQIDVAADHGVSRFGGMEQRTCDVTGLGTGLACWYVDPARAQGSTGWRAGTYDPNRTNYVTPLPKPFYVVRHGDREHRVWLREDTGYDTAITAHKRVKANARGAGELVWERGTGLCDRTTGRGQCAGRDPFGTFDSAFAAGPHQVRVQGWAIDHDSAGPIPVHVYVGPHGTAITANVARPDVAAAFPGTGANRGFDAVVPAPVVGDQQVCAYAINVGGIGNNINLGCRTVRVTGTPRGALDVVAVTPGAVDVEGWVSVPGDHDSPAVISVDGREVARVAPSIGRSDVQSTVPGAGATAGFRASVAVSGGPHTICLSAGGAAPGALGCRQVVIPTGPPFGHVDVLRGVPNGVELAGWAIDPDIAGPIQVHVYVGGSGVPLEARDLRPDVAGAHPMYGAAHGFSARIPAPPGTHQVCAYAINVGGGANTTLTCRTVTVPDGTPFGALDTVARTPEGLRVAGWAIDPDTTAPIEVHTYVGGGGFAFRADRPRPDVAAAYPGTGPNRGFDVLLPAPGGPVQVCSYAINVGLPADNRLLGCRTV